LKQIFSVLDKGGAEFRVDQRVQLGSDAKHVTNYTVTSIRQKDDGWVDVILKRIPEEIKPKMCWSEINTAMCIPPHWVVNVTDLMEEVDESLPPV